MYATVASFVLLCVTAATHADHHPCRKKATINMKGEFKAFGTFTYDSMGKKLRFRTNESAFVNTTLHLDLLMFFEEGILYEIDSKNQSCEKKALQCTLHPLDVPDDAHFISMLNLGSPSIEGEGMKVNVWTGDLPEKGKYTMSVTMGCLPVSMLYLSGSRSFNFDIETEIKDPDLLLVPSFCQGMPVEGPVSSFFNEFM
uniref:Ependymin-1-like n=1 Tax=Cynoglossus semilaevis TaxID=244447 RepID=A0A3P8X0L2_CYNSE